jgi:hypothetical protein
MKTNHLIISCVLLSLTGSGMLLNEMSAIAKSPSPSLSSAGKDPKLKTTPSSDATPVPPLTPITDPSPSTTSPVAEVNTGSNASGTISPLSIIAGLLHLLEIAGIVWGYITIAKLKDKNRGQINSLAERLTVSEQKQKTQSEKLKTQESQLKNIGSEASNTRNLTSRMNAIEQQAAQEKYSDVGYASSSYNQPSPSVTKAASAPSPYPFLDVYRQSPDNFKNQYAPKAVSEDADNLQKRWSGDQQEIILGVERQGNYWLFNEGSAIYLIPSPKLKVNDKNMRTVGSLFDCNNYIPGSQNMTVVRPAIVSSQPGANERWKLEQKGVLEFS